jgi:hypothetical protein
VRSSPSTRYTLDLLSQRSGSISGTSSQTVILRRAAARR